MTLKLSILIALYENEGRINVVTLLNSMKTIEFITKLCKRRATSFVSVLRTASLRPASAYRTVSASVVLVTPGTIPVDLLAAERMEVYKVKLARNHITGNFRENTVSKW